MARCRKMTLKELVARTEKEAGRKLNAGERAGLDLLPPQYDCTTGGIRGARRARTRRRAHRR